MSAAGRDGSTCERGPDRPGRLIAALLLMVAGGAHAQASPPSNPAATAENGKELFARHCAACHGADRGDFGRAMLPGTDALRIKYKGQLPALLEQRTDLTPQLIRTFVRRGTWSMPPFRKTEISDSQIDAISAYIADTARKNR